MTSEKKKIINRLKTIKGHIAGIEKMIEEDKSCGDIIVQVTAIKASIHKVGLLIMEETAKDCLTAGENGDNMDRDKIEEVVKMLVKFSK